MAEQLELAIEEAIDDAIEEEAQRLIQHPVHTSILQGPQRVQELLDNHIRAKETFGMTIEAFHLLSVKLEERQLLNDSTNVLLLEKLAIFLFIVRNGSSVRLAAEFFQHSYDTIHRYDRVIFCCLLIFGKKFQTNNSFPFSDTFMKPLVP